MEIDDPSKPKSMEGGKRSLNHKIAFKRKGRTRRDFPDKGREGPGGPTEGGLD